jgi:alkaline phosphatase D
MAGLDPAIQRFGISGGNFDMTRHWLLTVCLTSALALSACAQTTPATPEPPSPAVQAAPAAPRTPSYEETEKMQDAVVVPDGPIVGPKGAVLDRSVALTRIAFGSCLQQALPMPIADAILAARPQVLLMMGDNVYGDVKDEKMFHLRRAYYILSQKPEWRKLRAAIPMMQTWDDHDYGDNDAGADFKHKAAAQRLFADFWDLPQSARARSGEGVYESAIVGPKGQRVQIVMLDARTWRGALVKTDARNAPGKERYLPNPDPAQTMLGAAQWKWLERELKKPAELRVIVSSLQVVAEGHGWEAWRLLPAEREKLYRLIAKTKAKGVVFLSGDRHTAALYKLPEGIVSYPLYDFTSSSLNLAFLDSKFADLPSPERLTDAYRPENFGMLNVDWAGRSLTVEIKDKTGQTVQTQSVPFAEIGVK